MTISSEVRKAGPYTGNGTTTQFAFTFRVFEQDDVKVILTDAAGVETILVLNSDYYVTLNDEQETNNGGYITYPRPDADPLPPKLPSTKKITILGNIEYTQEVDLTNGGGFYPEVIESALDKITMQMQQLKEAGDRAVLVPVSGALTPDDYFTEIVINKNEAAASAAAASASEAAAAASAASADADASLIADNIVNINKVAAIDAEIVTVAGIDADVVQVALDKSYIETIGSDLGGGGFNYDLGAITDSPTNPSATPTGYIVTVYNNLADIGIVAGIYTNINTVASISSNVTTVANNSSNVTTVANDIANVNIVAGNTTNINTVAANNTVINTVATNIVDIQNAEENAAASAASAILANDWATKTSGAVIGGEYSAKYHAQAASASAGSASSAQTAAESARDATLAAFDSFDDRYLGTKLSDPAVDNDGNALQAGALYFNSVDGAMKVYTGSVWTAAYISGAGVLLVANNLSDLQSAVTARSNLGLGTAAVQNVGYFATSAQGSNADTAYGWGNHALAGYLTSLGIGTLTQAYDAGLTALAAIANMNGSNLEIDFGSIV